MLKNKFKNNQLNSEICEFIGAFIGDGYLANYGYQYLIGISGDKKLDESYLKNYLKPLIKRNFPFTEPKLYYRKDENTLMLRVNSKKLYNIFVSFGFNKGVKSRTIKIPQKIANNKELRNTDLRYLSVIYQGIKSSYADLGVHLNFAPSQMKSDLDHFDEIVDKMASNVSNRLGEHSASHTQ